MCRNGIPARLLALIAAIPLAVGLLAAGPLGLGGTGVALAAPPAGASDWGGIAEGQVRLIAGVSAAGEKSAGTEQAGETKAGDESALPFGLQFRMAKGWKIYWRSPGDAGYPPHLDWTGSGNLGAADLLWPAPPRFRVLGFDTFGYEDEVVLPIRVTPATRGAPLSLHLAVDYLVCQEICVPASAKLTLALGAGPGAPTDFAPVIDSFAKAVPGDGTGAGLAVESVEAAPGSGGIRVVARSKTPLVSWPLNPLSVSIAGTKRASTSTPAKVPRMGTGPTTTHTSVPTGTRAVTPNFTSRKRTVIHVRIPSDPMRMRMIACWMRSADTTGPIVVREACWNGPYSASRVEAISPSLPLVGICEFPPGATPGLEDGLGEAEAPGDAEAPGEAEAPGDADGLGLAAGEGLAVGEALEAGEGDGLGDPDGLGLAVGEPDAPADALAAAEALAPGEPDAPAVGDGEGLGDGAARRSTGSVRMSK